MTTQQSDATDPIAALNGNGARKSITARIAKRVLRALLHGIIGALLVLIAGIILYVQRMPDLKVWHTIRLDMEYTAEAPVDTFEDYLALEDRLFAQLNEWVYAKIGAEDQFEINRYHRGSQSDPQRWPTNWNRSFELPTDTPLAGVLLLHGLSDSPYSLRNLGERLHDRGAWVVGLRVPGHGTAPSGLVHVQWEDMAGAVALAVRHVREECGDKPLYIVGYSNGGALAVLYALSTLDDDALPAAQGLVLISPEIGVTKLARLAAWQEGMGHLLGLDKLSWNSIGVEYDPYKYNSFALNAGKQAYLITAEIQARIDRLAPNGALAKFPPVIAFQSVVDATVSAPALVENFFARLPDGDNELVVFDINHFIGFAPVLKTAARDQLAALLEGTDRQFTLTAIANENVNSKTVVTRRWRPGEDHYTETASGLAWPADVYSLSHVALPFAEDDPLYGCPKTSTSPGIQLGALALRGERGMLRVSPAEMFRLRHNPFYAYLEARVLQFMRLDGSQKSATTPGDIATPNLSPAHSDEASDR